MYVFQRSGDQWLLRQKLVRPESDPSGTFGFSVALNRNVLLIGGPSVQREGAWAVGPDMPDGHAAAGAVYVFTLANGRYSYRTRLRPTPDQRFTYTDFGLKIVTDGDRAVISWREPPGVYSGNGVALVYVRRAQSAVATRIARFFDFYPMALSGNRLILGSPYWVDYDTLVFYDHGWADLYSLPRIGRP